MLIKYGILQGWGKRLMFGFDHVSDSSFGEAGLNFKILQLHCVGYNS